MKTKTLGFLGVFAALALALAPYAARADLIYWMLDDNVKFSDATNKSGQSVDYTYATISADGGSTYLTAYDGYGPMTGYDVLAAGEGPLYFGSFDDSVSSFLVELWFEDSESGDVERVGWQSYNAKNLAESIWKGETVGGAREALTVTSVIPEPSSGLMLLLGGMLLALRRRKA